MSLIRRIARTPAAEEERSLPGPFGLTQYAQILGGYTSRVTTTNVETIEMALKNSVVWRCAMKNAATLASFPVHTYQGRTQIADPPIVADPAGDGSLRTSWVFGAALSFYLRGGATFWLGEDAASAFRPRGARLLHPDRVDWTEKDGWKLDGKPVDHWPLGPLYHIPLYTLDSPKGLNPLQFAARSLFPGMAAQEFGGNFFKDGAHPTSIIAPEKDPGEAGAQQLKQRVMDAVSGTNREPIVVPQSIKWTQMQVNPDDSQFIEAMKLSDEQVCRYMGTPPAEIGIAPSGSALTYANREQSKQDYLQELLFPKGQLEGGWTKLVNVLGIDVKLNPDGLLRPDIKARYESYQIAAEIGLLTIDEMRDLEDRPPLTDEDTKSQRTWQEVGLPALVQDGILTVNEARAQLGLGSIAGGDTPRDPMDATTNGGANA